MKHHEKSKRQDGFDFVHKYQTAIFLIIGLMIVSIFLGFNYKFDSLVKEQLHRQGEAFFREIILTREWAAVHGGVYVKLVPGMEVNPYLAGIKGIKAKIVDREGDVFILKNPSLITKEISEIAKKNGVMKFRITSLKPINPANAPDEFELFSLEQFEIGKKECSDYEKSGDQILFRYMAPLLTTQSCLQCHANQGYKAGDIRGGISVTFPATAVIRQIDSNRLLMLVSALGIVFIVFAVIRIISEIFIRKLNLVEQRLVDLASRDFLTGLLNRREMFNRLAVEIKRAERLEKPLSIIMVDIDNFKRLNDTYGHEMGDSVLKELSRTTRETLRSYDILCRYGGEEFLVAAPETSVESATALAERLRTAASGIILRYGSQNEFVNITISCGVAGMIRGENIEKTISRADEALYRAKEAGRNRVETALACIG